MDHLILARRIGLLLINKKNICYQVNFDIPVNHREKIKESETIDKNLDLARELKKL